MEMVPEGLPMLPPHFICADADNKTLHLPSPSSSNVFFTPICDSAPSGKNFACGFQNHTLCARLLEGARKAAELEARTPDFLLVRSLGGGTGSGVGSAALEQLRDDIASRAVIVDATVFPFATMDACCAINSTCALSWSHQYADATVLFQSEVLLDAVLSGRPPVPASCQPAVPPTRSALPASVLARMDDAMSTAISHAMLYPEDYDTGNSAARGLLSAQAPLRDLVACAVPADPAGKLLDAFSARLGGNGSALLIKNSVADDDQLARRFVQMLPRFTVTGEPVSTSHAQVSVCGLAPPPRGYAPHARWSFLAAALGAALQGRGRGGRLPPGHSCPFVGEDGRALVAVEWGCHTVPPAVRIRPTKALAFGTTGGSHVQMTIVAATSAASALATVLGTRVASLFQSRAFFHWYERFGLEEDTFIDYIERLKYIADASPLPKPPSS